MHGEDPRDAVERTLQFIWRTILGVPAIGVHDNFFDCGGDSLAALQMIATVEKAFGKNIPPAALLGSPTIGQLAAIVGEHKPLDYWSSLVPVQPTGCKPPFFWIHGDRSSVFLSQHLGVDQPLYLLTHQSEDGRPARFTEVKTIAEYYLREMRTVQKTGPFFIGGFSFGGIVALEIAQQLRQMKEQVGLLVLLDPPSHRRDHHSTPVKKSMRQQIRALSGLTRKEQVEYLLPRIENKFNSWTSPLREIFKRTILKIRVGFGYRIPLALRSSYILDIYQHARTRYVPQHYCGPVLLFKAKGRSYAYISDWDEVLKGETEIHEISSDHMKLLAKSEVRAWAGKLKPALLKAQSCDTSL
jgi:thioesterase domain-containing protein/acyl carrier protein